MHVDEARGLLADLLNQGLSFVIAALGYTPANKAGDTFTGVSGVQVNGIAGVIAAWKVAASGNGGAGRGVALMMSPPGSSSDVDAAQMVALQETASATANNASWNVDVADNTGTMQRRLKVNNVGQAALQTLGAGYSVKEGANAKMGTAVLVAGTLVVNTTAVTASSRIFLCGNADGGTPGWQRVSARTAGTSFTITSSNGADTSTVAWIIFEPS